MEVIFGRVVTRNSPAKLSRRKAREMLRHGEVHGKPLTSKQKGLFGLVAGGGRPSRKKGYRG